MYILDENVKLFNLAKDGSPEAEGELIQEYLPDIKALSKELSRKYKLSKEDRDDLVLAASEAAVYILRSDRTKSLDAFEKKLRSRIEILAIDAEQQKNKDKKDIIVNHKLATQARFNERLLESSERRARKIVNESVETLEPQKAKVLNLRYGLKGQEYDANEVSEIMDISSAYAKLVESWAICDLKYRSGDKTQQTLKDIHDGIENF